MKNTLNPKSSLSPLASDFFLFLKDDFNNDYYDHLNEKNGIFTLKVKVPGYDKNDIKILFTEKNSYERHRKINLTAENEEYGIQKTSLLIHNNFDEKTVKANLKNGILTITYALEKTKSSLSSIRIED